MPTITFEQLKAGSYTSSYACYWIAGEESYTTRACTAWLKKKICHGNISAPMELDAEQVDPSIIASHFYQQTLGNHRTLILVHHAHSLLGWLQEQPWLDSLLKPDKEPKRNIIFIGKPLDQRKKITQKLQEQALVISIPLIEPKLRLKTLKSLLQKHPTATRLPHWEAAQSPFIQHLHTLNPWSIDRVLQEIETWSLAEDWSFFIGQTHATAWFGHPFIDGLLLKKTSLALQHLSAWTEPASDRLLRLGLLNWHARQLLHAKHNVDIGNGLPRNLFYPERWNTLVRLWSYQELQFLLECLLDVEWTIKQSHTLKLLPMLHQLVVVFKL